jgi:hypothetical protein
MMFNTELETWDDIYTLWIRKLSVAERTSKILVHHQTVESFIGENGFSKAIQQSQSSVEAY